MFVRLRRFVAPPVFSDEDQTRTAALLNGVLLVALTVIAIFVLFNVLFFPEMASLIVAAAFAVLEVLLWWLLRHGAVRAASLWFCGTAFAGLVVSAYFFGGVTSPSFSALVITIYLAGILISGRAALLLTVASIGVGWLLMQAEIAGWFVPAAVFPSTFETWLDQSLVFLVAATVLGLTNRSLRRALTMARDSQSALQQRTLELEQERAALRASEERYRNFIEQSMEGIWRLEFDQPIPIDLPPLDQVRLIHHTGYIAECNEAMARMYGYTAQHQLQGKRLLELYGGTVNDTNVQATLTLVKSGYRRGNRETIEFNRLGEPIYFLNNAVGVIRADRLVAIWGMQRDVTDRKLIEQMLARRARHLQMAADVSRAVASILDLSELLPRIVDLLQSGFDLHYAGLFLKDNSGRRAVLRAATGIAGHQMLQAGHQLAIDDQSMVGWCMLHGEARLAVDAGEDPVRFNNPWLPATRSEMALPLINWGRVIGAITIQSDRPRDFTKDDAAVLQTMADQVAIAINNAQLFEAEKRHAALMTALHEIALAANAAVEEKELIARAMEALSSTLHIDYVGVLLKDDLQQGLRIDLYSQGVHLSLPTEIIPLGRGVTGRVALTGQPRRIDDVRCAPDYYPYNLDALSELCVPLKVGDRILGVINGESRQLAAFSEADEQLLSTVAGQLGTAIDRLRTEAARRQNEEELAQERNLLRTLIDNLSDTHIFVKDTHSRFITTNAEHLRTMGLTELEQVVGKTDFDFFDKAEAEQHYADEQAALRTGEPLLGRVEKIRDAGGQSRWYLTNKMPLRDKDGKIIGLVGASVNITERQRAAEREQAIARGLQAVVEAADELLQIDDLDLIYRRAVELAREKLNVERCAVFLLDAERRFLLGTYGTDVQGHTTDERGVELLLADQPEFFAYGLRRLVVPIARHSYWHQGVYYVAGTGWVATTLIGSSTEPIGVFSNDAAISQSPVDEVQQEALALYGSLLGNIIVRKRAAQERETLINELEAKNAELERFTYTVSHDLKSPLITIRGFMGLLVRDSEEGNLDRMRSDLARIRQATDKMQQLLNELLELSRIGRLTNAPEHVPLENIVREAVSLVEGRLSARSVQVEIAPHLPEVFVDRTRLVEVMQNLIDNAVKFMGDQPAPHIEVGLRNEADRQVFFVRDNGLGVDPRFHERVFGLFDKLDPRSEGTGIGLALVKRIIEVHGGRIWVESAGLGHGATFCFTLPAPG